MPFIAIQLVVLAGLIWVTVPKKSRGRLPTFLERVTMTEEKLARVWVGGYKKLKNDPAFGPWVRHIGSIQLPVSDVTPFFYLVRAICHQQLAGKAARTIHGRFIEAVGHDVSPDNVLRLSESTMRGAGLSGNKMRAIRDLATKIKSGELEVHDLERKSDEEIVSRVTFV